MDEQLDEQLEQRDERLQMLTTLDNPFNPFEDWDNWQRFDEDHGYYTMNYLARIAILSDDLSEADYNDAINMAIAEILQLNVLGIYRRVYDKPKSTGTGEGEGPDSTPQA